MSVPGEGGSAEPPEELILVCLSQQCLRSSTRIRFAQYPTNALVSSLRGKNRTGERKKNQQCMDQS